MFPVGLLEEIDLTEFQNVQSAIPHRTRCKQHRIQNLGKDDAAAVANIVAVATFKAEDIYIIMDFFLMDTPWEIIRLVVYKHNIFI